MKKQTQTIRGYQLPAPALTAYGKWQVFVRLILPFFMVLTAADLALYLLFKYAFHSCYGVWCLL